RSLANQRPRRASMGSGLRDDAMLAQQRLFIVRPASPSRPHPAPRHLGLCSVRMMCQPRRAPTHGEAGEVKAGGFSAPTQDVSGASGVARNETITAWAQEDAGETKCPTPGM